MAATPIRYQSVDEDSGRWSGFTFRPGDIVISTRSKSGTTWMQMICALLIFQTAELPRPMSDLSPWLDWLVAARSDVYSVLDQQTHRRFIKTHTPLDGIPIDPRATYIVLGRHPLDMAVSLFHHGENLDREVIRRLSGLPDNEEPRPPSTHLAEWMAEWITWIGDYHDSLDSLPGVIWHMSDAWDRRHEPNVLLVHYNDLSSDLEGEMRRLATSLCISVEDDKWPELVEAATFGRMRDRAELLAPAPDGVFKNRSKFFRRGSSGAGREVLTNIELAQYYARANDLAPADLLTWLHGDDTIVRRSP